MTMETARCATCDAEFRRDAEWKTLCLPCYKAKKAEDGSEPYYYDRLRETRSQCEGTTKKGVRCRALAASDKGRFCAKHQPDVIQIPASWPKRFSERHAMRAQFEAVAHEQGVSGFKNIYRFWRAWLFAAEPDFVACPVLGCTGRPVGGCTHCPEHQAEINRAAYPHLNDRLSFLSSEDPGPDPSPTGGSTAG